MKRIVSVFIVLAMLASLCSFYSLGANKTIKGLKIVSQPYKTDFYKDTDWVYGTWETSETIPPKVTLLASDKISFTHNPGSGMYPDRGMLDMTGLKIEVTYSDGSKSTITYTEAKGKTGFYSANIAASPKGGKYTVGTNTIEVYLTEDYRYYDSYKINIHAETGSGSSQTTASGDVNGDKKVNSQDSLLVLQHTVGLIALTSDQKKNADMNSDNKINSSDALLILKKATK